MDAILWQSYIWPPTIFCILFGFICGFAGLFISDYEFAKINYTAFKILAPIGMIGMIAMASLEFLK